MQTLDKVIEEIPKQKLNKELLYEIYFKMKENVDEGYIFLESMLEELYRGNDDDCNLIYFIVEGTMEPKYRFIIPDKNIDDVIGIVMIDNNGKYPYKRLGIERKKSHNQYDNEGNLWINNMCFKRSPY